MGKIVKIYPGNDGNCRVFKVRTNSGSIIRPYQRIYPLELALPE